MRRRNASRSRVPGGIAVDGDRRHRHAIAVRRSRKIAPSVAAGQDFATVPFSRLPKINALTGLVQLEKLRSTKPLLPRPASDCDGAIRIPAENLGD